MTEGNGNEDLRICYEAGPTGFVLARRLIQLGYDCQVIAPLHKIINHFKQTPTEFSGRPLNVAFAGNAKPVETKKSNPRGGKRRN